MSESNGARKVQRSYGETYERTHNILIAEPNDASYRTIEDTLKDIREKDHPGNDDFFFTRRATTTEEVIKLAKGAHWDLILLNMKLPYSEGGVVYDALESGFQALAGVQERTRGETLIIGDRDFADSNLSDNALELGVHYFLEEPLRPVRVRKLISSALNTSDVSSDPLTGLLSRKTFYQRSQQALERLSRAIEHKRRSGRKPDDAMKISMVFLDLDKFKEVNDTYGHLAGDAVLRHVGNILNTADYDHPKEPHLIRRSDVSARFGGDEFLIRLDFTPHIDGIKLARKVARAISNENYAPVIAPVTEIEVPNSLEIGVSAGVATFDAPNRSAMTIDDLLGKADEAMYAAKEARKLLVASGRTYVAPFSVFGFEQRGSPKDKDYAEIPVDSSRYVG